MERITELIQHPERMDRDTLYELRSLCALYPYYQTVRLLMLQNLYLLHDPTFDEELRRAAIYITDRRVLFNMIEASHYQLKPQTSRQQNASAATAASKGSRTMSLIDNFLDSIPKEEEDTTKKKRKPTPADAAIDYVAYLLDTEEESEAAPEVPEMPGQQLIDTFINSDKPKFVLSEAPATGSLSVEIDEIASEGVGEEYFTETLARIYIKQGRYSKALEIIQRLSLQFPKKNAYFADQTLLMIGIVLIQESKGGGLASNFSSYNQIGGVRKTTDFIEKTTWGLAAAMVVLSVACAYVAPQALNDVSVMENYEIPATNPNNLPGFGASQQKDAAAPAAPAAEAPAAPAAPAQPAK